MFLEASIQIKRWITGKAAKKVMRYIQRTKLSCLFITVMMILKLLGMDTDFVDSPDDIKCVRLCV